MVCGGIDKEEEAGPQVMLECDRCLSGCHMGCCAPPLHEVPEVRPEGIWGLGTWTARRRCGLMVPQLMHCLRCRSKLAPLPGCHSLTHTATAPTRLRRRASGCVQSARAGGRPAA